MDKSVNEILFVDGPLLSLNHLIGRERSSTILRERRHKIPPLWSVLRKRLSWKASSAVH